MRVTIERLRTLVLVTGGLVVVALIAFLVVGRWRSRFNIREIPKRLGVDIKQEANGVTYTQSRAGHTLFKIHASKVVQLTEGSRALLHDVQIELYSADGKSVDRITGNEFEYDQKVGTAKAAGPVEITIERPGVAPAIAPNATTGSAVKTPLASVANVAAAGQIDVKTSGLTFNQKTGMATTTQRVEFSTLQGNGNSVGATFNSESGQLILDRAVELNVQREAETVVLRAQHAEFARTDLVCRMRGAVAHYQGGEASAGGALIQFRADGTAMRLDASDGFAMTTASGAHVAAARGSMEFDEQNHPERGRLEGGVTMESASEGKQVRGTAPTADLAFTGRGELHHVHLERGVTMHSEQTSFTEGNQPELRVRRDWRSPVADVDFRSAAKSKVELASIRGTGGVVIAGETQRAGGPVTPSRMTADTVAGQFGESQQLTHLVGEGNASLEQTTATGTHQTTSGDRLEVYFAGGEKSGTVSGNKRPKKGGKNREEQQRKDATQIESATVDGNVVLTQTPATKAGASAKAGEAAASALRATAGHAIYEGAGEWLHLTANPRIEDGGLQLAADKVDVSRASGDAFAHGNVKATWFDEGKSGKKGQSAIGLGGQGPAHVIAAEAQLQRVTGEATGQVTFRGEARLWQDANSVAAPVIVLNRTRQTLLARGAGTEPVNIVLLSANGSALTKGAKQSEDKPATPSVVRIKAGDLKYSEAERKATLHGGDLGRVEADTGGATTTSNDAELVMLPPGNHAGPNGGSAQVDRLTAHGHVVVNSMGRRGIGEELVYSSETGQYVLTGTAAAPPRLTDPAHGMVTGDSLIFNSRDDSVSIEGQGQKTSTETTAPK